MPGLMDLLGSALGGDVQQQMSERIGADPQRTGNAIQAALPMLLAGLAHQTSQPGGPEALHGAIARDHDGTALDRPAEATTHTGDGAGILGHLFGGQQDMAHQAVARASGIDPGQAAQVLMMLAPLVLGALGRAQRQQNLDPGGLASVVRGEHANVAQQQPDLMGLAGQLFGGGGNAGDLMKGLGGMFGSR